MATATTSSKPPCKQQATLLDYDSDQSTEFTSTQTTTTSTLSTSTTTPNPPTPATLIPEFAQELMSLKQELTQFKETIATAIAQIKDAIASILEANRTTTSHTTEPNTHQNMDSAPFVETQTPFVIPSIIADLKHKLATIILETHALIHHQSLSMLTTNHLCSKT